MAFLSRIAPSCAISLGEGKWHSVTTGISVPFHGLIDAESQFTYQADSVSIMHYLALSPLFSQVDGNSLFSATTALTITSMFALQILPFTSSMTPGACCMERCSDATSLTTFAPGAAYEDQALLRSPASTSNENTHHLNHLGPQSRQGSHLPHVGGSPSPPKLASLWPKLRMPSLVLRHPQSRLELRVLNLHDQDCYPFCSDSKAFPVVPSSFSRGDIQKEKPRADTSRIRTCRRGQEQIPVVFGHAGGDMQKEYHHGHAHQRAGQHIFSRRRPLTAKVEALAPGDICAS
ncbi:uncharacterized protein MYCFIDRAFT_180506 [Pseudocercospora fijiensis CIRAD86]|uniref:Uncharacterized protein n=1 Tax=Pseudocercospora fijiensis (strain CIRAD86) TaxID=383855 RepID=M3AII4_PSEFD|nr:uncharacterized protein MYCFIDRAFT_180506 [Pseudocercospora fijiensis CIRAD86]EME77018.1 hypothetical protein MYCFIDRAFT_180506 [Pseudocercospora fijiensis CIRAD86]